MRNVVCCLVLAVRLVLAPESSSAQGPTAEECRRLPEELRLFFIAGYIGGFALAAQLPGERAAILQRCFGDWNNGQIMALADSWFIRNPREVQNPDVTARVALFQTLTEACGWKRRP
jgi:hypothetical protein